MIPTIAAIQKPENLFNQSYGVHIMPLVITNLGGGHTHTCTLQTRSISRNKAPPALHAYFKNYADVMALNNKNN